MADVAHRRERDGAQASGVDRARDGDAGAVGDRNRTIERRDSGDDQRRGHGGVYDRHAAAGRDAYAPWPFPAPAPDAVVINLGTNDRPPPGDAAWVKAYADFAGDVVNKYNRGANVTLFIAFGPMTDSYQGNVVNVTAALVAAGLRAFALDLTLPHAMTGCYGHPSAADNVEIAAKAKPQIMQAMGWAD